MQLALVSLLMTQLPRSPTLVRPYYLSPAQLARAVQMDGTPPDAMHRLFSKLQAGRAVSIAVVGSSVAMSGGCQARYQPKLRCAGFDGKQRRKHFARGFANRREDGSPPDETMARLLHNEDKPVRGFVMQVLDFLNASWPHPDHRVINAAADAWTAQSLEPCLLSSHASVMDADLVLLELGSQAWHPHQADASERIVRRLVRASRTQAPVLFVTVRQWCGKSVNGLKRAEANRWASGKALHMRDTWGGIEDTFGKLCRHYNATCLSMRDAIFHEVWNHALISSMR